MEEDWLALFFKRTRKNSEFITAMRLNSALVLGSHLQMPIAGIWWLSNTELIWSLDAKFISYPVDLNSRSWNSYEKYPQQILKPFFKKLANVYTHTHASLSTKYISDCDRVIKHNHWKLWQNCSLQMKWFPEYFPNSVKNKSNYLSGGP